MQLAARVITDRTLTGEEFQTVEVRPYSEDLIAARWIAVEAGSPLDVVYENGEIQVITEAEKLAAAKARQIELLKTAGQGAIYTHAPVYKQNNAALGVYSEAEVNTIKMWITTVRTTVDEIEAAINQLGTREAVAAVNVSYDAVYSAALGRLTPEQKQALYAL